MTRVVDVYFSTISPWAHLGQAPYLELAARHGLETNWRPVSLGPLFAETGGLPLAKRAPERRRYRDVELQRWAELRGRPLKLRPKHWPFDATSADHVALAIVALGEDPAAFAGAAMRGTWEEDRDLGARDVIAEILGACGHDAAAVLARAAEPDIAASYAANREIAQAAGVFGSPTYVLDGETFWGQDRLDLLAHALKTGRPAFRPLSG